MGIIDCIKQFRAKRKIEETIYVTIRYQIIQNAEKIQLQTKGIANMEIPLRTSYQIGTLSDDIYVSVYRNDSNLAALQNGGYITLQYKVPGLDNGNLSGIKTGTLASKVYRVIEKTYSERATKVKQHE